MMNSILFLWQEAAGDAAAAGPSPLFWPFMLVGMAVFYFFMIRPSVKEQKEQKNFSDNLKKGSKVVTVGGIHGTISAIEETQITLLIAPKTVITVQRNSISLEQTKSVYGNTNSTSNTKETAKA